MERRLYPRRRWGVLFFGCLLWIVVTASASRHSGGGMLSFICAFGVILSDVSLVPGAAWLKLDSQGFTVRNWFKDDTYRWSDIKEFKLITYRYMGFIPVHRSVGFTFSESYKRNVFARIAGAIASFDRNLPNNYGMKAQDLVGLLEACRREAVVGVGANPYTVPWPAIEPE